MLKRIISFLIVGLLVLQVQIIQAEGIIDAENYAPYISSEAFLKALNIVGEENNYNETVTRGKAASYISAMLSETSNYQNYRGIFSDVASSNEDALAIEKLADLGIVRGDGNYAFRPDDYITYTEATIIFMNVLGYGLIPQENTYLEAVRVGILDNVNAEFDVVNTGDIFVMMRNALMSNPISQTIYGSDGQYEKAGQTLLYKVFNVGYDEGIIIKNDLTYLWAALGNSEASIVLETETKNIEINSHNLENIRDDLGKKVRVYYYEDEGSGEFEYVHHELRGSNKIVKINIDQININNTDFNSGKVAYWQQGKSDYTNISLAGNYNLIYNNAAYKNKNIDFTLFMNKVGTIEFIDAESDGAYETIKIKAYESLVVGNILEDFITDKYKNGLKVDIKEKAYEKIFIYNSDGEVSGVDKIGVGSVVSVAISDTYAGNNILEIHISEDIRKGKITKYNKTEVPSYIIMDEKDKLCLYDRASIDEQNKKINYIHNSNIIAYVDVFGNVVYISDDDTRDMQYGLISELGLDEDGLKCAVKVNLVTASGDIIETTLSEISIIDGTSYKENLKGAYTELASVKINDTLATELKVSNSIIPVRYKMDEDGKLKIIDTIKAGNGQYDALEYVGGGNLVGVSGNVLGFQVPYNSDAVVLQITADDFTDVDNFREIKKTKSTTPSASFKIGQNYKVIGLRSGHENKRADFIIELNSKKLDANSKFYVFEEIIEAYNEEYDEKMYKICGYTGIGREERWISDAIDVDALKAYNKGDVLFMTSSAEDFVYSYKPVLICDETGVTYKNPENGHTAFNTSSNASLISMCGYVKSKDGTLVDVKRYDFGKLDSVGNVNWEENLNCINLTGATVVVVDDKIDKIYIGSANDILDYDNFGSNCSMILARIRSSYVNHVIVFK